MLYNDTSINYCVCREDVQRPHSFLFNFAFHFTSTYCLCLPLCFTSARLRSSSARISTLLHICNTIRHCSSISDVSRVLEAVRMRRLSDSLMSNPPTTPEDIRTLSEPRPHDPASPYRLCYRRLLSDDGHRSEMAGATYILLVSHPSPSSRPLGLWD